jgi:hypothetical protein
MQLKGTAIEARKKATCAPEERPADLPGLGRRRLSAINKWAQKKLPQVGQVPAGALNSERESPEHSILTTPPGLAKWTVPFGEQFFFASAGAGGCSG